MTLQNINIELTNIAVVDNAVTDTIEKINALRESLSNLQRAFWGMGVTIGQPTDKDAI